MKAAALFFDSETSGLPLYNEPSEDPRQPHIVQLGACLVDLATRKVLASLDVIVKPEGWVIPAEVAAIHGIDHERAMALGVPESLAVELLLELHKQAEFRVAHNEDFDARIVRIACKRFFDEATTDEWKAGIAKCTATLSTPILKLPPTKKMVAAGRTHYKTPNLGEAYRFFTGRELVGAHSAMVDVLACMEVFHAIEAGQRQAVTA